MDTHPTHPTHPTLNDNGIYTEYERFRSVSEVSSGVVAFVSDQLENNPFPS